MVDIEAAIRAYLAGLQGVTAAFGKRIYASRLLPSGYKPEQGPACLFAVRGGGMDFSSKLFSPSVQFRIYAQDEVKTREVAGKLFDAINDTKARGIIYARMEDGTIPTLMTEPDSNWPYILIFFKFFLTNE